MYIEHDDSIHFYTEDFDGSLVVYKQMIKNEGLILLKLQELRYHYSLIFSSDVGEKQKCNMMDDYISCLVRIHSILGVFSDKVKSDVCVHLPVYRKCKDDFKFDMYNFNPIS